MKRAVLCLVMVLPQTVFGQSDGNEALAFFENEAEVVSASHRAYAEHLAPATVHVVTAKDIKASGAQTLWDALRTVPGVDVIQSRSMQAEVSIRGLNRVLNNRTLVLLDGRSVLNALFDYINWETIPVSMEEIDRIEVVEGAASAVYGANAVNGIINIITKKPGQVSGGELTYAQGERGVLFSNYLQGGKTGRLGYRANAGWRAADQYENPGRRASEVGKGDALVSCDLADRSQISFAAGGANHNTQFATGSTGVANDKGQTTFVSADYAGHGIKARVFWNRYAGTLTNFPALNNPSLDYDTQDATIEKSFSPRSNNTLIVGGQYKANRSGSSVLGRDDVHQHLVAGFFEDDWRINKKLALQGTGRFDKHPLIQWQFSPRASVIFSPVERQTLRLSAGTAFRYPTLLENHGDITTTLPLTGLPPFTSVQSNILGNKALKPEKMKTVELAHGAYFDRFKVKTTGFYYKLNNLISVSPTTTVSLVPPTLGTQTGFVNAGEVRAAGGEFEIEIPWNRWIDSFANYSYQNLAQTSGSGVSTDASPHNKANAGIRYERGPLAGSLWANYVDETFWSKNAAGRVPSYVLLNGRAAYRLKGRLNGWEIGIGGFNMLNKKHLEISSGQSGEVIGSRWTGTVSYRFSR